MSEQTIAGPTELVIGFDALKRSAERMDEAARGAASAQRAMTGATVSSGAFGLMNAPLGAAAAAMAGRAQALVDGLDSVCATIAGNTATLERAWREVEEDADAASARLREALTEIDGDSL